MICRPFQFHVTGWKKQFHILDRSLTHEEWVRLDQLDPTCHFVRSEKIEAGLFFAGYRRYGRGAIRLVTAQQLDVENQKTKDRADQNRDKQRERNRARYRRQREETIARTSAYQKQRRAKFRDYQRKWTKENPDRIKQYHKTAHQRMQEQPEKRAIKLMRLRLKSAVGVAFGRGQTEYESARFLIWLAGHQGIQDTLQYEIDHIVPLSRIDLSTEENQCFANSSENVRWLTREQNASKSDDMPSDQERLAHLDLVLRWRETQ